MFPIAGVGEGDEILDGQNAIFDGEEDIDVMNDRGGGEQADEDQQFHHQGHVFMGEDQEVYDEEEMQYDFIDEEVFEPAEEMDPMEEQTGRIGRIRNFVNGIMDNPELYSAHYLNVDPDYLIAKQEEFVFDSLENPANIEPITKEARLAAYPEMQMLPPLRRNRPTPLVTNRTAEQKLSKFSPAAASLLRTTNFFDNKESTSAPLPPKTTSASTQAKMARMAGTFATLQKELSSLNPPGSSSLTAHPATRMAMADRNVPWKKPPKTPPATRKVYRPPPPDKSDPKAASALAVLPLTPLPDRFYKKRITLTAEQAGFLSECCQCKICKFMFRTETLLATHMNKHKLAKSTEVTSPTAGLICPVPKCEMRSDTIATVVKHMKMHHGVVDIPFERIVFKNSGEFKMWRAELERLTMSHYSRSSGKTNIFSKSTYYQCHHSGNVPSSTKSPEEPKKARTRMSKKLGKTCTAFFHTRENDDGTVLLRGCMKHTGHGVSVRHLPLSDEIRQEIVNYLIKGYDENAIVEKMKRNSNPYDRRYFIQAYEVRNVANKVEKFKEEYKRKTTAGEVLPNLAEMIVGGRGEACVVPTTKANLACNPYPVEDQGVSFEGPAVYDHHYYNDPNQPFNQVVVDDGQFVVPGAPNNSIPFAARQRKIVFGSLKPEKHLKIRTSKVTFSEPIREEKKLAGERFESGEAVEKTTRTPLSMNQHDEMQDQPGTSSSDHPARQSSRLMKKKRSGDEEMKAEGSSEFTDMLAGDDEDYAPNA